MNQFLWHYQQVEPTTWAYLSSLLMLALFFKFNRVWSVRNIDLLLLILLAPGLLLVHHAQQQQESIAVQIKQLEYPEPRSPDARSSWRGLVMQVSWQEPERTSPWADRPEEHLEYDRLTGDYAEWRTVERRGFLWLFAIGAVLLVRLLFDPTMVRRPLLDPNLSTGGLTFVCCSLFIFVMANVIASTPTESDLYGPKAAAQLLVRDGGDSQKQLERHGPGYAVITLLSSIPTMSLMNQPASDEGFAFSVAAKAMAILSHLAVVLGMIGIGYRHFDNIKMGIGTATIYMMLPYTTIWTGRVEHVLPAALLIWAVLNYQRPLIAGLCIGSAIGVVYYPMFLLPLWVSFYWQRGVWRFVLGTLTSLSIMTASLLFVSKDLSAFWANVQTMFGLWLPILEGLEGVWGLGWDPVYRIPVLVAFIALSSTLAIWPARKNLGTLLSCSAAVMVAVQFWHGFGGGLFVGWYLPLTLLTIFRPNLEDRVALAVLTENWFPL